MGLNTDTTSLHWRLDSTTEIRLFTPADGETVFALVDRNRDHLDQWLRWSHNMQTLVQVDAMLAAYERKLASGDGLHSGIWVNGELAGGILCRGVDQANHSAEIGYWLGAPFTGRGLAIRAAARLTEYLFTVHQMHRIEMRCAVLNRASRVIPERLGYTHEGTTRESYWMGTHYLDFAIYGLLTHEWVKPEF